MTFCLCICLLGVWFIGAPHNITVWVELVDISHGSTCTSDATTCKYMYVCVCVRTVFTEKQKSSETCRLSKNILWDFVFSFNFLNSEHTNGFDIITTIFHALPSSLFFFPHWKMQRCWKYSGVFWSPFTSHTVFESKKAGKQENLKWNIAGWKCI